MYLDDIETLVTFKLSMIQHMLFVFNLHDENICMYLCISYLCLAIHIVHGEFGFLHLQIHFRHNMFGYTRWNQLISRTLLILSAICSYVTIQQDDSYRIPMIFPPHVIMLLESAISILSGWWLSHPSEKYEFVSWDYHSQYPLVK